MSKLNKKYKICFSGATWISPLFNPDIPFHAGGGEVQLYFLGTELSNDPRYEIVYLVGDFGQAKIERFNKIMLFRGTKPLFDMPWYKIGFGAIKTLWCLIKINADIYFERTSSPRLGLVSLYCKIFKKKLIYMTAADIDCNGQYPKIYGKIFHRIYNYGLKNVNAVIVQSEKQQRLMKKNYGIESIFIKSLFRIRDSINIEKKFTLWIARCHWMKKPNIFLDMVKLFPNEKFVMISPKAADDHKLFDSIKQKAKTYSNLTFIEEVSFIDSQYYFDQAKVFVNTSTVEGFPNTFLQAGLSKTPILSLDISPDDFLHNIEGGVCTNGNIKLFFSMYEKLVNNIPHRKMLGNNIFEYVKKHHNAKSIAEQYKKLMENI